MPSLLLGCGNDHRKRVFLEGYEKWVEPLIKLDMNTNCGADVIWDLEHRPLPFEDETFDELAAYDVLEHIGKTGDWRGFFDEFAEYHRILKPLGTFGIVVPVGKDAFADPGHTRFFGPTWFAFLSQSGVKTNLEMGTNITDYRWYWKKDFNVIYLQEIGDHHFAVILQKQ
jgi:predicted SAM-dependent methyltransferase